MTPTNTNLLLKLIKKRFGLVKQNGSEVNVNCPFCEIRGHSRNTTYKLGISLSKEIYHCFRCGVKGKLAILFPQLSTIAVEADKIIEKAEVKEESLEPLPSYRKLDYLDEPWNTLVYNFLHDKGVSPASVAAKIFFIDDYRKNNYSFGPRLLFPIYQFNSYRGFQARTIYKNTDPKYIGASNMDRRSILYNFDNAFKQDKQLVLTEGFFDQMRVGDTAVATLGKNITEEQIRLIKLGSFKRLIVFLDKDAKKESYAIAHRLKLYGPTYIALPKWEDLPLLPSEKKKKDPGDMTREEIADVFNNKLERVY